MKQAEKDGALVWATLQTAKGPVRVGWGKQGLSRIELGASGKDSASIPDELKSLKQDLENFFSGRKTRFKVRLNLTDEPEFTRKVLQACARIPFGEIRTYGDLAREVGNPRAARAVGQALARNPIPVVIPCHRVLGSGGGLGGFGCGLDWKRFLLSLEGVSV